MTQVKPAFEVDKKGLAQILARRGIQFAALELLQNAFDEKSQQVTVSLYTAPTRGQYVLCVRDDNPDGFANLSHAYTLFASSAKKANPEKRGRFNLGEKLVIAASIETTIATTTGTVRFDDHGRHESRAKTAAGSEVTSILRMTRAEAMEMVQAIQSVIPPAGMRVAFLCSIDGRESSAELRRRRPLSTFAATLATEIADDEGYLRATRRQTVVEVHECGVGETAKIYEMGIPVVETGDAWHVNVMQKVPLSFDRDNVTPAYLRTLRAEVANHMRTALTPEIAAKPWVSDALASGQLEDDAVRSIITARYGEKVVVRDPSDAEGTKNAVSQGYQVIEPGSFDKDQWAAIRKAEAALPAGRVTPSKRVEFSNSPDAKDVSYPRESWTRGMRLHVAFARRLGERLLRGRVYVDIVNHFEGGYGACFGHGQLLFNVARLGKDWFERSPLDEEVLRLLVHEFGHSFSGDHLSSEYHDGLCKLAARLAHVAMTGALALFLDEAKAEASS